MGYSEACSHRFFGPQQDWKIDAYLHSRGGLVVLLEVAMMMVVGTMALMGLGKARKERQ